MVTSLTRLFTTAFVACCLIAMTGATFPIVPQAEAAPAPAKKAANTKKAEKVSTKSLDDLVQRVTPQFAGRVVFKVSNKAEHATIKGSGDKIIVKAKDISECARAYGHYLRNVAHVHLSWNGDNFSAAKFVVPDKTITVPDTLPYNFAFNYCTLSYTAAHWDKKRWERELDRLALQGYKYVLVTSGLEKVWQGFLKDIGYPKDKTASFIPMPTHAAWWNMGNLEGEGGPVSQAIIDSEAKLGKFIVNRCRLLGMEPVLQGYVGFLPHDFPAAKVRGKILPQGDWCNYKRPAVLQPTSEGFPAFAALWYKNLQAVYGYRGKAFGGDLFHEGGRKGDTNLGAAAKAVQDAMQKAAPDSLWFIQAWGNNPDAKLLAGTDEKKTVVLFLNKDMTQQLKFNFQGRPHIWCELSNFGGNHGLYGGFKLLENMTGDAGGCVGLGLLSEGLETNPLYYALFTERLNNRGVINRDEFLRNYCLARYGCVNNDLLAYLKVLADSVYKPDKIREGCLENILGARPGLSVNKVSTWSNPQQYYAPAKVQEAAEHLLAAGEAVGEPLTSLETYRYDLVDICRQVLADRARTQLASCRKAFQDKNQEEFKVASKNFIKLIDDSADILATSPHFLLGVYLQGARSRGVGGKDATHMERSLRQLITTWRPNGASSLNGYAHREFSEIMLSYNKPRWQAYFKSCIDTLNGTAGKDAVGKLDSGSTNNNGETVHFKQERNSKVEAIENAFPSAKIPLLSSPKGDIMTLASGILHAKS